jgi:hypothetical protein
MQFTDLADAAREALKNALLQYRELDMLARAMRYEHWDSQYSFVNSEQQGDRNGYKYIPTGST